VWTVEIDRSKILHITTSYTWAGWWVEPHNISLKHPKRNFFIDYFTISIVVCINHNVLWFIYKCINHSVYDLYTSINHTICTIHMIHIQVHKSYHIEFIGFKCKWFSRWLSLATFTTRGPPSPGFPNPTMVLFCRETGEEEAGQPRWMPWGEWPVWAKSFHISHPQLTFSQVAKAEIGKL